MTRPEKQLSIEEICAELHDKNVEDVSLGITWSTSIDEQVLGLLCGGIPVEEAAAQLGVSVRDARASYERLREQVVQRRWTEDRRKESA